MTSDEVYKQFCLPFAEGEVKYKPQSVKGNRALALAYIDARLVEDRLDETVGVGAWKDEYEVLGDGSVMCRLHVKIEGEWVTKSDVGSPSEQPDHGDRMKAAFSDALKRAAVKFGIGRYLYRLTGMWSDYDPVKKRFVELPTFGSDVEPKSSASQNQNQNQNQAGAQEKKPRVPVSGAELIRAVETYEGKVCDGTRFQKGYVFAHLTSWGKRCKPALPPDIEAWPAGAIPYALRELSNLRAKMESTAPAKPAENFKAPEPQAEASATTENDVGAREEADILSERLHILAGQLGKPARELIDAHRKTIGAPNGAKRFGELTIAQCRALVQILENLTTA